MELKNIFKMEMFKNRHDTPYLVVIAILTGMAAVASILGVWMINTFSGRHSSELPMLLIVLEILLAVFTFIGLGIFSLLYPFHLLNVDYKNRVISLIFASGVPRGKFYFVKIGATILSCLIATFVILFIPIVTFLIVKQDVFIEIVRKIFDTFNSSDIFSFVLSGTFSLVANIVILTTSVIITKGKTSGIFLYLAFLFAASIIQTSVFLPLLQSKTVHIETVATANFYLDAAFSTIKIIVFVLIGLNVLKKQDL